MIAFFHDHIFFKFKNSYYTTGSLNKQALSRYVESFGQVKIVTRQKKVESIKGELQSSNMTNVEFVEVPNYIETSAMGSFFEAIKIIEREVKSVDFIVARLPSSIGAFAIECACKHKKPYLIEVVGCPWDGLWNHSLKGKLIAPYAWYKTRKLVKSAPYVLYVTEKFLQNRYPSSGKTIACSNVCLPPTDESVLTNRILKIKSAKRCSLRLATIAALNVCFKGQQYVINALAELKKEGYLFEYYLVGGGDSSYLRSVASRCGVSDQVKILGPLEHKNIPSFLDSIDIYIQPSKQEGLPRALIEAMSRGCPSLGSATGGIPELLDEQLIFEKGSIKGICSILNSFTPELMLEEAIRNFQKAREYDAVLLEKRRRDFFLEFKRNSSALVT